MRLPRYAQIWGPGYFADRMRRCMAGPVKRVWLAVADHFEPLWRKPDSATANRRVAQWAAEWPQIAECERDSAGQPPQYTFFFPEEEYRHEFLKPLASMARAGIADVEIHLHHDGEGRRDFIDRITGFCRTLHQEYGMLRKRDGRLAFGFIHGNWALDNSRPDGRRCGLNDEITILRELGCYADFTMPSGAAPTQARKVNSIYWATDDPDAPKSYDGGPDVAPGGGVEGDLLMIPGPFGLRWAERLLPRIEFGDLSHSDPPTEYRARRWFELGPRIGGDLFLKLHTHGCQEKNAEVLLAQGGLRNLFHWVAEEARRQNAEIYFVTAWQMFLAVEALRLRQNPRAVVAAAQAAPELAPA
ncbi:MAG: hypothetical protein JO041_05450 [Acidobacteria bacterium]|nr:hypothetical protein [Acidobacteriota bacterium]